MKEECLGFVAFSASGRVKVKGLLSDPFSDLSDEARMKRPSL